MDRVTVATGLEQFAQRVAKKCPEFGIQCALVAETLHAMPILLQSPKEYTGIVPFAPRLVQ